jgi:hypothetical protein
MTNRYPDNAMTLLIRHAQQAARVVVVHEASGFRCLALEPVQGPVPEWNHLAGASFPDLASVHRAVEAVLRGTAGDTLDLIDLAPQAYKDWFALVQRTVARWRAAGRALDPESIPDEQAIPLPDGSLELVVELPGERLSLVVPPGQWTWRIRPS